MSNIPASSYSYVVAAGLHLTDTEYKRLRKAAGLERDASFARRSVAWLTDLVIAYRTDHPPATVDQELRTLLAHYRPYVSRHKRSFDISRNVEFKGDLAARIRQALGVVLEQPVKVSQWGGVLDLAAYTYLAIMLYLDHISEVAASITFDDLVASQHRKQGVDEEQQ